MKIVDNLGIQDSIRSMSEFFVNYDYSVQSTLGAYDLVSKDYSLNLFSNVYNPDSFIQNVSAFTGIKDFANISSWEAKELSQMRRDDFFYSVQRNLIATSASMIPFVGKPITALYYMSGADSYLKKEQEMKYDIYYSGRRNVGSDVSNRNDYINYGFTSSEATVLHKRFKSIRKEYGYKVNEASDLFKSADKSGYFKIKDGDPVNEYDKRMEKLYKEGSEAMKELMMTASETGELMGLIEQYQVKNKAFVIEKFSRIQKKLGISPYGSMSMVSDMSSFMQGHGFFREMTMSGSLDIINGFKNDRYDPNLKVEASKNAMNNLFKKNNQLMIAFYNVKGNDLEINNDIISRIVSGNIGLKELLDMSSANADKMTPLQVKSAMTPNFLSLKGLDAKSIDMVSKRIYDLLKVENTKVALGIVEVRNKKGLSILQRNNNPGGITSASGKLTFGSIGIESSPGGKFKYLRFKNFREGVNAAKSLIKSNTYANLTVKEAIYKWKGLSEESNHEQIYNNMFSMPRFPLQKDVENKKVSELTEEGKTNLLFSIFEQEGYFNAEEYVMNDGTIMSSDKFQNLVGYEYLNDNIPREAYQSDWVEPEKEDLFQKIRFKSDSYNNEDGFFRFLNKYGNKKIEEAYNGGLKYDSNKLSRQENIINAIRDMDGIIDDKEESKNLFYRFNKEESIDDFTQKNSTSKYKEMWDSLQKEWASFSKHNKSKDSRSFNEYLYAHLLSLKQEELSDFIEYGIGAELIKEEDALDVSNIALSSYLSNKDKSGSFFQRNFKGNATLNIEEYFNEKFGFKKGSKSQDLYSRKDFSDYLITGKITKEMEDVIKGISKDDYSEIKHKMKSVKFSEDEKRLIKSHLNISLYESLDDNIDTLKKNIDDLKRQLQTTEGKRKLATSFNKVKEKDGKMYMCNSYMLAGSLSNDPNKNWSLFNKYNVSVLKRMFPGMITTSTVRSGDPKESKHNKGLAIDFVVPGMHPDNVVKKIFNSGLPITELFSENDTKKNTYWIHYAYDPSDTKRVIKRIKIGHQDKTVYSDIIGL